MNKIRRLSAFLLALIMAVLSFSFQTFAVPSASSFITSESAGRGDTVTLKVSVSNCDKAKSGSVNISFDGSLELVSAGWLISGATLCNFSPSTKKGVFTFGSDTEISGDVFEITLNVKSDASFGNHSVSYTLSFRNAAGETFDTDGSSDVYVFCSHNDTSNTEAVPATCKDTGYTAGIYCNDCNKYLSGHEVIQTTNDHSYGDYSKVSETVHGHTCSVCGKTETSEHKWNGGTVTTQPTHTTEGVKAFTCTDCGAEKTEAVAKLTGHSYGEWVKHNETQHKKTCVCGDTLYENHSWDNGVTTKAATCKDEGVKTLTCTVCGETKTESIAKTTNHVFGDYSKTDENKHSHTCSVCGKTETSDHSWNSGTVTTQPTHTTEGVRTFTCTDCGAEKTEAVAALTAHSYGEWVKHNETQHKKTCVCGDTLYENHGWDNGVTTKAATCKDEGVKTFTCTVCGETKTESIAKTTNHVFGDYSKTDENKHSHTCSVCGKTETSDHSWNSGTVTTQPTHTTEGVRTFTCTDCGAEKTEAVAALTAHSYGEWVKHNETQHKKTCICGDTLYENHSWDNGVITKAATCKDEGVKTFTCTACGETKTETVPKASTHTYGKYEKTDEKTHSRTCLICGYTSVSDHSWGSGTVTTMPTHLAEGVRTYTCVCGAKKTETVQKDATHKYGDWAKYSNTQHKKTCECGDVQYEEHKWNAGTVTVKPTCKDTGTRVYVCAVCGESKTESVPVLQTHTYSQYVNIDENTHRGICSVCGNEAYGEHQWDTGTVTEPATEDSEGIRTLTCVLCGAEKTEEIPKLDHAHEYGVDMKYDSSNHWVECKCGDKSNIAGHTFDSGKVITAATCLESGKTEYKCTVCGYTKTETVQGEHAVGEWETVRAATCTVDGIRQRKCAVCGEITDSEDIKATGHVPGDSAIITEATCTEPGISRVTCTVCGETLSEETIPATGHSFGDWTNKDGILSRSCVCGETEEKQVEKKAEIIEPTSDGIKIDVGEDVSLPEGTVAKTENLTDKLTEEEKSSITSAIKVIADTEAGDKSELVAIYDISLEFEGSKIQPDGTLKIELPIPAGDGKEYSGYKVVYIDDNGVAHDMEAEVADGKLVFTTTHFSKYAVVGVSAPADGGISLNTVIIIAVCVAALLGAFIVTAVVIRKKRAK